MQPIIYRSEPASVLGPDCATEQKVKVAPSRRYRDHQAHQLRQLLPPIQAYNSDRTRFRKTKQSGLTVQHLASRPRCHQVTVRAALRRMDDAVCDPHGEQWWRVES
jgi:hypothetical protein